MAEVLVNLVLGKLCDAVLHRIFFLGGINDKVEHVKRELNRIQCFLRDADRKSIRDERVKNWVSELRDVSYWIEDTIDLFVMELDELSEEDPAIEQSKLKKLKRMFEKPKKHVIVDKFGKEIDKILARIDEIAKSREIYGIQNLGESSEVGVSVPFKKPIIPGLDNSELVGVEDEKKKIVEQLLDEKHLRRSVVSIVGPGGLGKTTVAEKAYSSCTVNSQFKVLMWITISQSFAPIDLLKKMLEGIRPLKDDEKDKKEEYFMVEVNKSLRGKKYLVVLDDVWSDDLWSQINLALPDDKNGSRVLMTSRFFNIPKAADPSSEPHKLRFLSEEESIELLLKTTLSNRDDEKDCRTNLLDIARQLAKKCDGLPLALVVLGGCLSLKPRMHSVWEKLLNTMVWSVDGKKCMDILATSYDDMPVTLKPCFMYFAGFPEDYEINAKDLIRLWVAEGFALQISNKAMEDVAEDYLEELAHRSMIHVTERSSHDNSILNCRIHDLLRDVAIEKAKENNFMTVVCANQGGTQDFGRARRVAVYNFDINKLMQCVNSRLRALMCFNLELPDCSANRLIKVLYVETKYDQDVYLTSIEGLTQLRFLKISTFSEVYAPNQEYMDKLIGNMKFLQVLDIDSIIDPDPIFVCMWHIKTLRHVNLAQRITYHVPLLGNQQSIVMENLQTLSCIEFISSEITTLLNLPNLRSLNIDISEGFPLETVVAFFHTLKKLVVLRVGASGIPIEMPIEMLDMNVYPFYQHLTLLSYIGNYFHRTRIIALRSTMLPIHLTQLEFSNFTLGQSHINELGKLPELKHLILSKVLIDKKFMRFSAGSFSHLEILTLDQISGLEKKWEIERGAMPMLKELTVVYCLDIAVPVGMQHLTVLRVLNWYCNGRLNSKERCSHDLRYIQDVCKHVPLVNVKFL